MMIMGIPNVGKSTLMNALLKRKIAKVGDEPAVTKSQQTIRSASGMTITDTPGLMWPKIEHDERRLMLAASHAIGRNAVIDEEVAVFLAGLLLARYPALLSGALWFFGGRQLSMRWRCRRRSPSGAACACAAAKPISRKRRWPAAAGLPRRQARAGSAWKRRGLAWWALDFPFMRRHSEEVLKAHPELRRKDQEATRLACQKFSLIPTSVMNFCEGTRFTPAKQQRQQSPFRHLLKPKAGGIALALNVMGDRFRAILDVTIVYPDGAPSFWDFLCGRMKRVHVRLQALPVPRALAAGDYAADPAVREACQRWLQQLWQDKDAQIERLLHDRECRRVRPLADGGESATESTHGRSPDV
jgi:hypothetical protein